MRRKYEQNLSEECWGFCKSEEKSEVGNVCELAQDDAVI